MGLRRDLDGLRLQKPGDPDIYLIDQGMKRHIADPMTYNGLFRDWNSIVQDVDTTEITPDQNAVADTSALIQGFGDSSIYFLDAAVGQKRHIANPATMNRYDFA